MYKKYISTEALDFGLKERREEKSFKEVKEIVSRVCKFYIKLKKDQKEVRGIYQPGGEWAVYVNERKEFYDLLLDENLEGVYEKLRNFWRNELGPIASNYAYYPDLAADNKQKVERFTTLMSRDYVIWQSLYGWESFDSLNVPNTGNPWGYSIEGKLVIPQAFRFHNHAKQISGILSDVKNPVWAEIGGGYGGTPFYYFNNALKPRLTYVDFDLPETLVIAAYYLLSSLPDRNILLYDGVISLTKANLLKYDVVLMPNYALEYLEDNSIDLFLNAFSFSEMTMPILQNYFQHLQRTLSGYFLHNNMDKKGVVNRAHERIPCSDYPIDPAKLKLLYKKHDLFQGYEGDYRECLYQKIK